jgi:hypothetical protein
MPNHLVELLTSVTSWDEFVRALREADAYWQEQSPLQFNGRIFSVLGDRWSWEATIQRSRPIARREDWENMTEDEKNVLFGRWTNDGAWDLLGNMSIAIGQSQNSTVARSAGGSEGHSNR